MSDSVVIAAGWIIWLLGFCAGAVSGMLSIGLLMLVALVADGGCGRGRKATEHVRR